MPRAYMSWFLPLAASLSVLALVGCGSSGPDQIAGLDPDDSRHQIAPLSVGEPTEISVSCSTLMGCWINWEGNDTWDEAIIYRSSTDDFATATEIGREWAGVFFVDEDIEAGARYYYWVVFQDDHGRRSSVSHSASACVDSCQSSNTRTAEVPSTSGPQEHPSDHNNAALQFSVLSRQAPVYTNGNLLFVGVDQGMEVFSDLQSAIRYGSSYATYNSRHSIDIMHTRLSNRERRGGPYGLLADYLEESAKLEIVSSGRPIVTRFDAPPSVYFGGREITQTDIELLMMAVQMVNTALPFEWRIQIPSNVPTTAPAWWNRDGKIYVEFISREESQARYGPTVLGSAGGERIGASTVFGDIAISESYMDHGERDGVTVLVHELIHALGIGHVSRQRSIMAPIIDRDPTSAPNSILYPIDREALRALYGRMQPGDMVEDFGYWSDNSTHLLGIDPNSESFMIFGVSWRNNYGEPWAYGGLPQTFLADNPALTGNAVWEGALLGFTPEAEPVSGDAAVEVHLADLTGSADFTNLESWTSGEPPGNVGSGSLWHDGDLEYSIAVAGNTFVQTGGDDGFLTGGFFGESHEAMGGTLERDDLTAAFGGTR